MKVMFLTCVLLGISTNLTIAASVQTSITLTYHGMANDIESSGLSTHIDPIANDTFQIFNVDLNVLALFMADENFFAVTKFARFPDSIRFCCFSFPRNSHSDVVPRVESLSGEYLASYFASSLDGEWAFDPHLSGIGRRRDRGVLSEGSSGATSDQNRLLLISCGLVTMILLRRYVVSQGKG